MVPVDSMEEEIISEINLTPLVDVSLVLVIIFMIVAPFFSNILKPLLLPPAVSASLSDQNSIKVSIFPDGALAVGPLIVSQDGFAGALRREMAAGKRPWAIVRAGTDVSSGRVMDVVKDLKRLGIERVAFAAQSKEAVVPQDKNAGGMP